MNLRKQCSRKLQFPAKSFSIQTLFTPLFTPGTSTNRLEFALALQYSYLNYSNEMAVMVVV